MRKILFFIAILFLAISCKNTQVQHKSSPHILKFYFGYHKNVPGIEQITFTVDTFDCTIYNTDSIIYEANLTRMLPYIVYKGSPSKKQFNGTDWNSVDSIDFSHPVQYRLVSNNKKQEATYTITLNKHTVDPEEIVWNKQNDMVLDGTWLNSKACAYNNLFYVFVQQDSNPENLDLYTGVDANSLQKAATMPCNIQLNTIQAHNGKLYAISTDNKNLCVYENNVWEETASFTEGTLQQLIGSLNGTLYIACVVENNAKLATYNNIAISIDNTAQLPNQFALPGATPLTTPHGLYLLGGLEQNKAQNCVISSHNGFYWTNILNQTGQYAYSPRYQATVAYYQNIIFIFGGLTEQGTSVQEHYYSTNNGYSWNIQKETQNLPDNYQYQAGTDALVLQDNLYIIGPSEPQSSRMSIWKGRIRKADFKIK